MNRPSDGPRRYLIPALFLLGIGAIWHVVCALNVLPAYSLPAPVAVLVRLGELARDGSLWVSTRASLIRMALGFTVAAALGLLVGLTMGVVPVISRCLRSLFLGIQTLPSAAWVPIALLLFGLGDGAIYFVIVMSSTAAMAIATADAVATVPPVYLRVARNLGAGTVEIGAKVMLPAALPGIITGLKLGWTLAWHGVVSAELIKSTVGIGFLLHMGRELNDAAQVVGIMLVTIAIGIALDHLLFSWVERRVRARWGLESES
jgi:NitT/TauT family transport system permease protein